MKWYVYSVNGKERGIVHASSEAGARRLLRQQGNKGRITLKLHDKQNPARRKNPTKAQKREKSRKASQKRAITEAARSFVEKANPGMKTIGAAFKRLKGGVLKITPIKALRGRK